MHAKLLGAALPAAVVGQERAQRADQAAVVGAVVLDQGAEDAADQVPGVLDTAGQQPGVGLVGAVAQVRTAGLEGLGRGQPGLPDGLGDLTMARSAGGR